MTRTGPLLAAMVVVILALPLSVVIWPAGAAARWSIKGGRLPAA